MAPLHGDPPDTRWGNNPSCLNQDRNEPQQITLRHQREDWSSVEEATSESGQPLHRDSYEEQKVSC